MAELAAAQAAQKSLHDGRAKHHKLAAAQAAQKIQLKALM